MSNINELNSRFGKPGVVAIEPNPFLALLPRIKRDVDERLEAFFEEKLRAVAAQGPEVTAMLAALMRLGLRGGKRIRPALLYLGYRIASPRGSADIALQAEKLAAAAILDATKNAAAISAQLAECCCELKEAIGSEGQKTRYLINANTVQGLRDALAAAQRFIPLTVPVPV